MNTVAAKQKIKECFQTLKDEQLQQYHLTHDYFSGRPLDKSPLPLNDDAHIDVAAQNRQRDLDVLNEVLYPAPTLSSVLGESLAALKINSDVSPAAQTSSLAKPSEDLVNRAKNWFSQYQKDGLVTLLPAQSNQLSEANIAVVKRGFSSNTIRVQNACMLAAFWIRDPQDWNEHETTLLEHLFVQYEAPAFLKTCWSRVFDEENIQWLLCYLMYVQGGSLKALANIFRWKVASHKLWHYLFSCRASMLPQQAVLYAEYKRLGGWNQDFAVLMANNAYVIDLLAPSSEENRAAWYDSCVWTINKQCDLTKELNGKVLWWARHQLTEFAQEGKTYRLQGRSLAKVKESIAAYEFEKNKLDQARARMAARALQVSRARIEARERMREDDRLEQEALQARDAGRGYYEYDYNELMDASWKKQGWDWSVVAHGKKWHIVELTNTQALYDEGEVMEHCVGGYSINCLEGESAIFSLRCEGGRVATVDIDPLTTRIIQMQGQYNAEPKKSHLSVVNAWVERVVKS